MISPLTSQVVRRQLLTPTWRSSFDCSTRPSRFLHETSAVNAPRKRHFFSSNAFLQQNAATNVAEESAPVHKRKNVRSPAGKRSLRRVAVEAQTTRGNTLRDRDADQDTLQDHNGIVAICVAEEFDMDAVVRILRSQGYPIDPHGTGFLDEQVVHTKDPDNGDIFIFPSGTVVSWSMPEELAISLATHTLLPAAINPNKDDLEMEDLDFKEDPTRDSSSIKGDVITLGTKVESQEEDPSIGKVDTTLAKIAFSSGLARSTKLAVLETMLDRYFESTRKIPTLLSKGSRVPFSRSFILQKTGQLLEIRAQLNHYSELTDSLPDLFWDSRHELGLEGYYDQVGRALDVGVRIKTLNEKMDYAQEIASILRETQSHAHSAYLEWIIIVLIAVEIGLTLRREWKERREEAAKKHS